MTPGRHDGAGRKECFQGVRCDPRSGRIGPVDQSERPTPEAAAKGRCPATAGIQVGEACARLTPTGRARILPSRMAAPRSRFFTAMAVLALLVAFTGFAGTYFLPVARGSFHAPLIVHAHGVILFGWLGLFLIQSLLIHGRDLRLHRRLGWAGGVLAVAVAVSTIATGMWATQRDVATGGGDTAVSSILGTCTAALVFLALVAAAIAWRRDGPAHKRLMVLASIAILWPAWFRFRHYFPFVPVPEISFAVIAADSLFLVCIARDWLVERRVHPVFLWVGPAIIAQHILESVMFDSPLWRAAAHAVFNLLGG